MAAQQRLERLVHLGSFHVAVFADELEEIARPGKYTVAVPSPKTAGLVTAALPPAEDFITPQECRTFYENAPSPAPNQWYKNSSTPATATS